MTGTADLVDTLAAHYLAAKAAEESAIKARRAIAQQIQALTGWNEEGSKTYTATDFKVVVKQPMNRTMDWKQWEVVKTQIPVDLWPVETKTVLDEKGAKWLQNNEPQLYAVLATAITIKPGTVQVTVTPITE
jgi:hypothetical protein